MNNTKSNAFFSDFAPAIIMILIMLAMLSNLTDYANDWLLYKSILLGACTSMYFLVLDKISKPIKATALGLLMACLYIAFTLYIEQPSQIMQQTIISLTIGAVFAIYRPMILLSNLSFLNKNASD